MRRTIAITITAATLIGATVGCSSNDDQDAVGAWCDDIEAVDHRVDNGPSDEQAASVRDDIRTVIRTAPDDIAAEIDEVGTAAIEQMSPGVIGPDESSRAARDRLENYVRENCDGYELDAG